MKSYLITLSPLEPYFFGGERNFGFGEVKGSFKQSYYISSLDTPSQTTLLGALRYAVLAANDALITDFSKDSADRKRANELVGAKSFDFSSNNSFGAIGGIHPLFLADGPNYLVPMPMNHKGGADKYTPIQFQPIPQGIKLSNSNFFSPDYVAKDGCGGNWLNLTDDSTVCTEYSEENNAGLFQSIVRVGINAHRSEKAEADIENKSYFKKAYKMLRRGTFAFFADMESEPAHKLKAGVTVYLGQNRSAFILKATEKENDLSDKVSAALSKCATNDFWYAPADCHFSQSYNGFMIAKTRLFRHLTASADNRYYYRINKTEQLYRLMSAGAVFYGDEPDFTSDKISQVAGMNELILIKKGE